MTQFVSFENRRADVEIVVGCYPFIYDVKLT